MATQRIVQEFNQRIKDLHQEAEAHRDAPRFLSLLAALTRLTNSDEDNAKMDAESKRADDSPASEPTHEELMAMFKAGKIG